METNRDFRKNSLANELTQGKKSANELKRKLPPDITSIEICSFLLEKVLTHYDNALSILESSSSLGEDGGFLSRPEPRNEARKTRVCKKRKMSEEKKDEVRVCSSNGGDDSQLTDGYNWRKYGQKGILGAAHPRAYYRCTHRQSQGCLATKKVQQTDEGPSIFQVVYRGKHSCVDEALKQQNKGEVFLPLLQQENNEEGILLPPTDDEDIDSFSFGSKGAIFDGPNNQVMGTAYSTPFLLSPETPESYFSVSNGCQGNDVGAGCSNSGFNEILSETSSLANFYLGNFDNLEDFGCRFFDATDFFDPYIM